MYVCKGETSTGKYILQTLKRSAANIGVVRVAAIKEKYSGKCLLRAVFIFITIEIDPNSKINLINNRKMFIMC